MGKCYQRRNGDEVREEVGKVPAKTLLMGRLEVRMRLAIVTSQAGHDLGIAGTTIETGLGHLL